MLFVVAPRGFLVRSGPLKLKFRLSYSSTNLQKDLKVEQLGSGVGLFLTRVANSICILNLLSSDSALLAVDPRDGFGVWGFGCGF